MIKMFDYVIVGVLVVWLGVLSFFLFKTRRHYYSLTTRTKQQSIDDVLDTLLNEAHESRKNMSDVKKSIENILEEMEEQVQSVGMVRFNPFGKGGNHDQSFVIAFLNKKKTGVLLNFIYTSDGMRIYTKRVKAGKGEEHKLTEEEEKAIVNAL